MDYFVRGMLIVCSAIWIGSVFYTLYLGSYMLVKLFKYQKSNTGSYWP